MKVIGTATGMKDGLSSMKTSNSDRVKITKPCQANCQIPAASIITQLEEARNQIHTHSGEVENSVDVLGRLREGDTDSR